MGTSRRGMVGKGLVGLCAMVWLVAGTAQLFVFDADDVSTSPRMAVTIP